MPVIKFACLLLHDVYYIHIAFSRNQNCEQDQSFHGQQNSRKLRSTISRKLSRSWAPSLQSSWNGRAQNCDRDVSNSAIYTTTIYRGCTVLSICFTKCIILMDVTKRTHIPMFPYYFNIFNSTDTGTFGKRKFRFIDHVMFIFPNSKSSRGPHGAHLGHVGPKWAPCWLHEPCYEGCLILFFLFCWLMIWHNHLHQWNNLFNPK